MKLLSRRTGHIPRNPCFGIARLSVQWVVAYTGCTLALLSLNYCQLRTSQAANEISRESFVSVQRAYVIVDDVKIVRAADKGPNEPSWFFFPNIRNVGNTQTSELQIRAIGGESLGDQI